MRMRHYCDFCKKSGGSAKWMRHHEEACTANPDRICRVCPLLPEDDHAPLPELVATFVADGFKAMKAKAGNCPACMLAVIRKTQGAPSGWPWDDDRANGLAEFNFKAEMKAIFDELNANRREDGYY